MFDSEDVKTNKTASEGAQFQQGTGRPIHPMSQ